MTNLCQKPLMTLVLILTSFMQESQAACKENGGIKTIAHNIKQVASDPQAPQINLMRHQWMDLLPSKNKRKAFTLRPPSHEQHTSEQQVLHIRESLILNNITLAKIGVLSVVIPDM